MKSISRQRILPKIKRHFIWKDIATINVYVPNNKASKYLGEKMIEQQQKRDNSTELDILTLFFQQLVEHVDIKSLTI